MRIEYSELRSRLVRARDNALETYKTNKANGSTIQSVSFDSGRYYGLKESIELFDAMWEQL